MMKMNPQEMMKMCMEIMGTMPEMMKNMPCPMFHQGEETPKEETKETEPVGSAFTSEQTKTEDEHG